MVYICLHGETEWDAAETLQGSHKDSPLTQNGRTQSIFLGEAFKVANDVKRIFSTPQDRGCQTAALICSVLNIPDSGIITDKDIGEKSFRRPEGLTMSQIEGRLPAGMQKIAATPESHAQVAARLQEFVGRYDITDGDVIVTHSATQKILMGLIGNISEDEQNQIASRYDIIHRFREEKFCHIETGRNQSGEWQKGVNKQ